ncbi:hypothetical protein B8V81_3247 [Paenibacillus pasadenensis]|uniref:Oligosaccharide repeat unit polymerase n=1 Tax=Paenibacillus pasadenensis TaxID=217090 RepID=A0A2N5N3A8_9BACL|nr:oligosaccharide repeat unit polymerase [Paenibacillus pasadenensis]PLT44816.1 hypothetical protein B8V81_3247 [Paenibacillus pasadenensis]
MAHLIMGIAIYGFSLFILGLGAFKKNSRHGLRVLFVFFILGQILGVFGRFLFIASGTDTALSPLGDYAPSDQLLARSLIVFSVFNISIFVGLIFFLIPRFYLKKTNIKEPIKAESSLVLRDSTVFKSLFAISTPGILLTLASVLSGNTLVANSNLESERIDVSGQGPLIFINEIPFASILLWYAYKKGNVGMGWWVSNTLLIFTSLLTGNRSKMVMVVLMVLGMLIYFKGYRQIVKRIPLIMGLGSVIIYLGWIIIYVRGNLLRNGGNFFHWAIEAIKVNPSKIINELYRSSFNGFDGFLSILTHVPTSLKYQYGQFWYESLTIIIPRFLWKEKWELPLTNVFTNQVWGWSKGGIFTTGPGVLYLDSGMIGVFIGGVAMGLLIGLFLIFLDVSLKNYRWLYVYILTSIAYFLCRFSFAGGSNDVVFLQRLMIEGFMILVLLKLISYIKASATKTDFRRRGFIEGSSTVGRLR